MNRLFVVNNPGNWPLHSRAWKSCRRVTTWAMPSTSTPIAKVFNLCRSYRYMSSGYYVSLLAGARGHRAPEHQTCRTCARRPLASAPRIWKN